LSRIKRALLSVYDKKGIVSFAKELAALGVELISTGGTAELLKKEGLPVKEVASVTHFPEMLGGRVKTLHPAIHAGLLALREDPKHMETLSEHNIKTIDLLVVNLYPFWDAVKTKTDEREIIEMIDIGGPAMLRSAAKNFKSVACLSNPEDYEPVMKELRKEGVLSELTRRTLAAKVFKLTSCYDAMIRDFFMRSETPDTGPFPRAYEPAFERVENLRYGENPHQKSAFYREKGQPARGIVGAKKLHGKELSFNNFLDLDAAMEMVASFSEPACAIIKHTNPCGFATAKDLRAAFNHAYDCDPLSAFGSIIGFNGRLDGKTAKDIVASGFVECVIASGFDKEALEAFAPKKNVRLLETDEVKTRPCEGFDFKRVSGGLLVQERDLKDAAEADLKCVTKAKPKKSEIADLLFAFKICHHLKSNAIVVAKGGATVGLGMGQTSRVDSAHTAFRKAGDRAKGAVLASDGFFPKADSILLAKKHGISSIIQPGGSIQDAEVIAACDKAGIAMVFTGIRHFKH